KLAAGDMVVYPATSLHQVTPITRGVRTSCFFWAQSLLSDEPPRALLYAMDGAIQRLNQTNADETARRSLIGCYHNLVRQWSETLCSVLRLGVGGAGGSPAGSPSCAGCARPTAGSGCGARCWD